MIVGRACPARLTPHQSMFGNFGGRVQTRRMKKFLLAVALLAWGAVAVPSQLPKPDGGKGVAARPSSTVINAEQLLEDVRILSADAMEGRRAGQQGGAMARAYIVTRLDEAGMKP